MAIELNITERTKTGGRSAKQLRRTGMVPAIFYGKGLEKNFPVTLDRRVLEKSLKTELGHNALFKAEGDSSSLKGRLLMIKDLSMDPLTRKILHADLLEVRENEPVRVTVPVSLEGRPVGFLKEGVLEQIRREITIECVPSKIPPRISIDVSPLDIGDSIHIQDVKLEEGQRAIYHVNYTIATMVSAAAEEAKSGAPEAAAGAAPAAAGAPAAGAAKGAAPAKAAAPAKGKEGGKK